MKKAILSIFLMLIAIHYSIGQYQKSTNQRASLIGLRFKDYRELVGITKLKSTVINLHYGVAQLWQDGKYLLLVSKFENSTRYQDDFELRIMDVIEIPRFDENYHSIALKSCMLNGKSDATIFAMGINEENKKVMTKITKAWKLDKSTGKIMDFQTAGIRCINDDFDNIIVSD